MKTLTIILMIVSIIANIGLSIVGDVPLLILISCGAWIWGFYTLAQDKKSKACGFLLLFLCSPMAGFAYLSWKPEQTDDEKTE